MGCNVFKAAHNVPVATPSRRPPDAALFPYYMQNAQGLWLRFTEWWPRNFTSNGDAGAGPAIRGVVFVVSGLGEYSGRYDGLARRLNSEGYVVFSVDNQGAGGSEGERQYVERFSHFVDDMQQFVRTIDVKYAELAEQPRILIGHSMGGLISTLLVLRMPSYFTAVVLSGPALMAGMAPGKFMRRVATVLARVTPKMPVTRLCLDGVNHNMAVREFMDTDPYYGNAPLRARFVQEMLSAPDIVFAHAHEITVPLLIVHGEEDTLCKLEGPRKLLAEVTSSDKELLVYPDCGHEILTEVCYKRVQQDVVDFINAHCVEEKSTAS